MVIQPNSTIILYTGMPLDNTYTDTLYFSSKTAQTNFFTVNNIYFKRSFSVNTYQRVNLGVFEANCKADDIYDCNYMAFQNTNFGDKWFYAFINSVEYVNNQTTRVNFEIDVMQTYLFDAELEYCYVEREHSASDEVGDNILPEPVSLGEYLYQDYHVLPWLNDQCIVVGIVDTNGNAVEGQVYDGIYGGAKLRAYNATPQGVSAVNTYLSSFIQKMDSIVCIYMCPKDIITLDTIPDTSEGYPILYGERGKFIYYLNETPAQNLQSINGYIPKNKKLFTYPYNYYHVDNGDGQELALRYEFFQNNRPRLLIEGCVSLPIQVCCRPVGYKGIPYTEGQGINSREPLMTETLTIATFPLCSWNYDTFQAWVAQNLVPSVSRILTGIGYGGAVGGLGTGLNELTRFYEASIQADTCRGNVSSGNVNYANNRQRFYVGQCSINAQNAEVIDNFFTRYGYACNKIKLPNRSYRPHWNYVKTNGCNIIGKCPSEDIKKMCNIYDTGITFWKNASEVGNYLLDNRPVNNP